MKVRVYVSLKNGVLDPQGRAIQHSLEGLGFAGVQDVRAGRFLVHGSHDRDKRRIRDIAIEIEAGLNDSGADRIMAATGTQC